MLTVVLSAGTLVATLILRTRPHPTAGRRAAVVAGQLLPALVCFSTVGRLWLVPGALLLAATALTVAVAPVAIVRAIGAAWPGVLTVAAGLCYALAAAGTDGALRGFGLAAGLVVAAVPWIANRSGRAAWVVLVLGAIPFAAVTWWALVTPFVCVLALIAGFTTIHGRRQTTECPTPSSKPVPATSRLVEVTAA